MQSRNGTWPAPASFDAGFNSIEKIIELIEKQVEVLKQYPNKATEPKIGIDTRLINLEATFGEEETSSVLKQAMESLESYHADNFAGDVVSPVARVKLNLVRWITGKDFSDQYLDYISRLLSHWRGEKAVDAISRSTRERPGIILDSKHYTSMHDSAAEFLDKLAGCLEELWPVATIRSIPNPIQETKRWKVYKCAEKHSGRTLGIAVTTATQNEVRDHALLISQAEAIAYLLAERAKTTSRGTLDLGFFFLSRYCNPWSTYVSLQFSKVEYKGTEPIEFRIQLHMRSFIFNKTPNQNPAREGIICDRIRLEIQGTLASGTFSIVECRRAFDIRCPVPAPQNDTLQFMFIRVVDNSVYEYKEYEKIMPDKPISFCRWAGIATFQKSLFEDCLQWENEWMVVLTELDLFIGFKIQDMSNKELLQQLMYDDRKLSRSENYFLILRLLRVFEDWIKTTEDEITKLAEVWEEKIAEVGYPDEIITKNWNNIVSTQHKRAQRLLNHIEKKIVEHENLRSGLYNALSVREATRSTRMNQIMLLFTLATILYLPPTFVATFMALDLFQASNQTHFWNVFGGAIGVTYLAAIIALVAIYRGETVDTLSSAKKWLSNEHSSKAQKAETESRTSVLGKLRQRFHTKGESQV